MSTFAEYSLSEPILNSLQKLNFLEPTPIQKESLPHSFKNKDILATAQTGTGKTAAFCLPMLQKIMDGSIHNALILVPTREIGIQIEAFLKSMLSKDFQLNVVLIIGGVSIRPQFKKLQNKPDVIIATPGRVIDHLERRTIYLHKTDYLVLDEADRMLDMGFKSQLNFIVNSMPKKRQTLFFSATFQKDVQELAKTYLNNPTRIKVGSTHKPIDQIHQRTVQVNALDRLDKLMDLLNEREGSVLVFMKMKYNVEKMYKELKSYGFELTRIHGDRSQSQRQQALKEFRLQDNAIMLATDVAARGIDVPHIKHVINFDPPQTSDDYVHRIGRTARAGQEGEAINFVTPASIEHWDLIYKGLRGEKVKYKNSQSGRKKPSRQKKVQKKSKAKKGMKLNLKSKKKKRHD